jgi:K+-transporting ATPase ATPase C chain
MIQVLRSQVLVAVRAVVVLTVVLGFAYPLVVTLVAQTAFGDRADGSLVRADGRVVGSSLLGQPFDGDEWFHPRPSAAGDGYDGMASSASNLGPTNSALLEQIAERERAYRSANAIDDGAPVPVDAVTASASGLDPHISVANARLQAPRVARARGLVPAEVLDLVEEHTDHRIAGFLGEDGVNVLLLNLAVERLTG